MYTLSKRSLDNLTGVHNDLVQIVRHAITISTQDFVVIEGLRSRTQCMINYGKGRSASECIAKGVDAKYAKPFEKKVTWLKNPFASKHCAGGDGKGCAVDIAPYPIDWQDTKKFDAIADAMFKAQTALKQQGAIAQSTQLVWGADWNKNGVARERGEYDAVHWQI